jgi:hypothetical protein
MTDDEELELVREREAMIFEDPREAPRVGATVLRLRSTRLDLETFAPLLVERLHVPKFEATKLCQLHHGMVLDNVEPAVAEAVAADLRAHGEECLVVPAAKILKLPRPHPVHAMRLSKTGLAVRSTSEDWYELHWADLSCLTMGTTAVEEVKRTSKGLLSQNITASVTNVVTGSARSNMNVSKTSTQHPLLDFVSLMPLAYCRIDGRHFDYSLLGDQLQSGSMANLLTLARWLLTYAPQMRANVDIERLRQTGTTALPSTDLHGLMEITEWQANLVGCGAP